MEGVLSGWDEMGHRSDSHQLDGTGLFSGASVAEWNLY